MRSNRSRSAFLVGVALALVAGVGLRTSARAETTFEVVKSFELPASAGPLVVGSDGALYGGTEGVPGIFCGLCGTPAAVFRIDSAGAFSTPHAFPLGAARRW
jgi:hypothetical protein